MKLKTMFPNPQVDFFIKSYLLNLVMPFILVYVAINIFYLSNRDRWKLGSAGEGPLVFFIWGFYLLIFVYFVSLFLVDLFILFFNNKLMSGKKINKKTKFVLFLLSILFYILTLILISFLMSLF